MRYLRLVTILIFVAACALLCWTLYSISLRDTAEPQIMDSVGELHLSVSDDAGALMQGLTATDIGIFCSENNPYLFRLKSGRRLKNLNHFIII